MTIFQFGAKSQNKLDTCHPMLQEVAQRAIQVTPVDFTIVWCFRGEEIQNALFESGSSKKPWPESNHNHQLDMGNGGPLVPQSKALDFAPWIDRKIPWKDTHVFAVIAGVFFAVAKEEDLHVQLRWGGDWDMDGLTTDQTFMDWGHLEIRL